jgi:hypothetical protein
LNFYLKVEVIKIVVQLEGLITYSATFMSKDFCYSEGRAKFLEES